MNCLSNIIGVYRISARISSGNRSSIFFRTGVYISLSYFISIGYNYPIILRSKCKGSRFDGFRHHGICQINICDSYIPGVFNRHSIGDDITGFQTFVLISGLGQSQFRSSIFCRNSHAVIVAHFYTRRISTCHGNSICNTGTGIDISLCYGIGTVSSRACSRSQGCGAQLTAGNAFQCICEQKIADRYVVCFRRCYRNRIGHGFTDFQIFGLISGLGNFKHMDRCEGIGNRRLQSYIIVTNSILIRNRILTPEVRNRFTGCVCCLGIVLRQVVRGKGPGTVAVRQCLSIDTGSGFHTAASLPQRNPDFIRAEYISISVISPILDYSCRSCRRCSPLTDKGYIMGELVITHLLIKLTVAVFHLPAQENISRSLWFIRGKFTIYEGRADLHVFRGRIPIRISFKMYRIGGRHIFKSDARGQTGFIGNPGIVLGADHTVNMPEAPTGISRVNSLSVTIQTITVSIHRFRIGAVRITGFCFTIS